MSWGHNRFPGGIHPRAELALTGIPMRGPQARRVPHASAVFLAQFLDALTADSSRAPGSGPLSLALRQTPTADLGTLLNQQTQEYRDRLESQWGKAALSELMGLARETDRDLLFQQLLNLSQGLIRGDRLEPALALLQEISSAEGFFSGLDATARSRALRELQAVRGQGAVGPRVEFMLSRFAREASDPWMIAGFGAGSLAYKAARLGVLARLAGNPAGRIFSHRVVAGLLASGAGLSLEVPVFVFTSKLGHQLSGAPQDWSAAALGHELAATGLTLSFLKTGGALSRRAQGLLNGPALGSVQAVELGALARLAQTAIPQAGMLAGIVTARRTEEALGLRPRLEGATLLVDSLSTYFQFIVGGRLAERVLGPGFAARQRELDLAAQRLSSLPNRYSGPSAFSPNLAGAGAAPGRRATLQELMAQPLLSENQNGDGNGKGNGNGKFPHLRPVALGEMMPTETQESRLVLAQDVKAFATEVRTKLHAEAQAQASALSALRSMTAQVQTYLIHLTQGRAAAPEMDGLRREILQTYELFLQRYLEVSRSHEGSTPLIVGDPVLQAQLGRSRVITQQFLDQARTTHPKAQKLLRAVSEASSAEIHAALRDMLDKSPKLRGRFQMEVEGQGMKPEQEILFAKFSGILQGIGVKEAYRGSTEEMQLVREHQIHPWNLLSKSSARTQDHQIPEWLFAELRHFEGRDWDPSETLIVRAYPGPSEAKDAVAREVVPREILRWGGTYSDPFRTWIGVQLPTLFAAYGGESRGFLEKIRALEIFMEPETREATGVAAWWLGKALRAEGFPSEWAIEREAGALSTQVRRLARGATVDLRRAEAELGQSGDKAVVGHALLAFLRHPFDPRASLELALQAPETIREDVVSLTGALLGAFHGGGAFPSEWMSQVILSSVPTRNWSEATRQMTDFINKEISLHNGLMDLQAISFGDRGRVKVTPLHSVKEPQETAVWRAFRAGHDERFNNGELTAVQALWEASVMLEQGRSEGISAAEWRDLRKNFRVSLHRMELSTQALRDFRKRGEAALASSQSSSLSLADFDLSTAKLERTASALRRFYNGLSAIPATRAGIRLDGERHAELRKPLLEALGEWSLPGLEALQAGDAEVLPAEGIRALQRGAVFIGRSVRPPAHAPLFEARSDAETVDAVLQGLAELEPIPSPSAENLMESYLLALGSSYVRRPGLSLAHQISPSALFSVLTPAYLEANAVHPTRALRELTTLKPMESPELREAWRVATYAALRLLQGAKPDLAFAQELRRSFVHSTMAQGLNSLIELQVGGDATRHARILLDWEASSDARSRVLLGLQAFLRAPEDAKSAVKALSFSAVDPHQVAERVAGMLAEAHRAVVGEKVPVSALRQQKLDSKGAAMLELKRMDETRDRLREEVLATMAKPASARWREALEAHVVAQSPSARRAELRKALDSLHPELLGVFGMALDHFSPSSMAQALFEMKLLSQPLAAFGETKAPVPLTEQDREALVSKIREDYRTLFGSAMAVPAESLAADLGSFSEGTLGLLGHWTQHPGSRLLMAQRLGVRGLPDEKTVSTAYQKWNDTPPQSE